MVAASLATVVLAGVMSAFLFIGRTGFNAGGYSEMAAQTRQALDVFANDARMASGIQWNSSQSITLVVPGSGSTSTLVTYAYDRAATGPTAGCFYRLPGAADSTASRRILVRHVAPGFSFRRYKLEQNGVTDHTAANDLETKLIQLDLQATRTAVTTVAATQTALSARYLLRNKRVSN
jgi:Tfp pilus assembly protein PilW